jgi:hypothetical protein
MASGALIVLPPQYGSREYPVRRCLRMLAVIDCEVEEMIEHQLRAQSIQRHF